MATVVIFGAGVMGTATAFPLTDNGHAVRLVGTHLDDDIIQSVQDTGFHPTLRRRLPDTVSAYTSGNLADALKGADFLLSGVNSYGVRWSARTLAGALSQPIPIIAITKGLDSDENGDILSLTTVYERELIAAGGPQCEVSGIGGPCIAGELAGRRQSCVVFGSSTSERARWFADHFRTDYYHIWPTNDLLGLEIAAALKNAYTLPVGIASGLLDAAGGIDETGAAMHNLAAAIFGQGASEIRYILESLQRNTSLAANLPGAGDYYVTCAGGRNMTFGRHVGAGKTFAEARSQMPGQTLESLSIVSAMATALPRLYARGVLEQHRLPLMEYLIRTVSAERAGPIPYDEFFPDLQ